MKRRSWKDPHQTSVRIEKLHLEMLEAVDMNPSDAIFEFCEQLKPENISALDFALIELEKDIAVQKELVGQVATVINKEELQLAELELQKIKLTEKKLGLEGEKEDRLNNIRSRGSDIRSLMPIKQEIWKGDNTLVPRLRKLDILLTFHELWEIHDDLPEGVSD